MIVKSVTTVFNDYKKTGMLVAFPRCSFKCCYDACIPISCCQNSSLAVSKSVSIEPSKIVDMYDPKIHGALICGGLEPLDSEEELLDLIFHFRIRYEDDVVIYTGYELCEISEKLLTYLKKCDNIIIKIGRYIPDKRSIFDSLLGVELISDNQYAIKI